MLVIIGFDARLERGDDERTFGRIADDLPTIRSITLRGNASAVTSRAHSQRLAEVRYVGWINHFQFDGLANGRSFHKLTLGSIANARHLKALAASHDLANRHLISRQRARLVGANHSDRS